MYLYVICMYTNKKVDTELLWMSNSHWTRGESSQVESSRINLAFRMTSKLHKNFVNCIMWQSAKSIWEKFQIQTRNSNCERQRVDKNTNTNKMKQTNKQTISQYCNQSSIVCFNHTYLYVCVYGIWYMVHCTHIYLVMRLGNVNS